MQPISPVIPGLEPYEIKIAESQDEYGTLPALPVDNQRIITHWRLTWRERLTILFNGSLYLHVWTFNSPLQPLFLEVDEPKLVVENRINVPPPAPMGSDIGSTGGRYA